MSLIIMIIIIIKLGAYFMPGTVLLPTTSTALLPSWHGALPLIVLRFKYNKK